MEKCTSLSLNPSHSLSDLGLWYHIVLNKGQGAQEVGMSMSLSSGWVISLSLLQIVSTCGGTHYPAGPPEVLLFLALPMRNMHPLRHRDICGSGKGLLERGGTLSGPGLSLSKRKCVCRCVGGERAERDYFRGGWMSCYKPLNWSSSANLSGA